MWELQDKETGVKVEFGTMRETSKGQLVTVLSGTPPHKPSSTGFVYVEFEGGARQEFYAGVVNAKWVQV